MLPDIKTLLQLYLILIPPYVVFRMGWLRLTRKKRIGRNHLRETGLFLFFLSIVAIIAYTLIGELGGLRFYFREPLAVAGWRLRSGYGINLEPFRTIRRYLGQMGTNSSLFYKNIVGNVALFLPFGFGFVLFWKKNRKWYRMLLVFVLLPVVIEGLQLFIGRQVDVDDVLLNLLGSLLGALFWRILCRGNDFFRKLEQ